MPAHGTLAITCNFYCLKKCQHFHFPPASLNPGLARSCSGHQMGTLCAIVSECFNLLRMSKSWSQFGDNRSAFKKGKAHGVHRMIWRLKWKAVPVFRTFWTSRLSFATQHILQGVWEKRWRFRNLFYWMVSPPHTHPEPLTNNGCEEASSTEDSLTNCAEGGRKTANTAPAGRWGPRKSFLPAERFLGSLFSGLSALRWASSNYLPSVLARCAFPGEWS